MFSRIRRFVAEMRGAKEASRLLRTAYTLEAEDRYAEATEILKRVRTTAEHPAQNSSMAGLHLTTRLRAATLLATTAAKLGDRPLALDAIEEGLRLWAQIKNHMAPGETTQRMTGWETWAKRYATGSDGG